MGEVSLFTREWIEIQRKLFMFFQVHVSLFTREWIEMQNRYCRYDNIKRSPSLRGSGLKFFILINKSLTLQLSPSLRGSGLKWLATKFTNPIEEVSLFTREWIEIFDCGR